MSDDDDTALVRRFQKGDPRAYEEFVARHSDRLYRLARAWTSDVNLAEDAVQETFLRTYTGLGKFRFRAAPATWLYRVCRNVCRELNRKFPTTVDSQAEEAALPMKTEDRDLGALWFELRQLPQRQRDVVVFRVLEGFSVRETAQVLRCREGTVKAHLHKALQRLRAQLEIPFDE